MDALENVLQIIRGENAIRKGQQAAAVDDGPCPEAAS